MSNTTEDTIDAFSFGVKKGLKAGVDTITKKDPLIAIEEVLKVIKLLSPEKIDLLANPKPGSKIDRMSPSEKLKFFEKIRDNQIKSSIIKRGAIMVRDRKCKKIDFTGKCDENEVRASLGLPLKGSGIKKKRRPNSWIRACQKARKNLGIKGFGAVKKGTPLYKEAMRIKNIKE